MLRRKEFAQFAAQLVASLVRQNPHARQVAVLVVERDLLVAQAIAIPFGFGRGKFEQVADKFVARRKISRRGLGARDDSPKAG